VLPNPISRAGEWLLHSGIQEPNGGVARYYRADLERNLPISTEITGYAASTFAYLHTLTGDERYLDRARHAAAFLIGAWDAAAEAMPFELDPPRYTYFFDCGIIARGLIAAGAPLEIPTAIGKSMARDFAAGDDFHPILSLPDKQPTPRDALRWSQSSGCYHLKSALAWVDVGMTEPYDQLLEFSLRTWGNFLPGHPDRLKVMDRLHPFLYFLEGLLPRAHDPRCAAVLCEGIRRTAHYLRDIAPDFARSDVYAQLLRVRLYADALGAAELDVDAAGCEAERLMQFQVESSDPRINGGFYFGRKAGEWLPHVNPVSTAFAIQALAMWETRQTGASVI
jgi:hypothetical protein